MRMYLDEIMEEIPKVKLEHLNSCCHFSKMIAFQDIMDVPTEIVRLIADYGLQNDNCDHFSKLVSLMREEKRLQDDVMEHEEKVDNNRYHFFKINRPN